MMLFTLFYRAGFLKGAGAAVLRIKRDGVPGFLLFCPDRCMTLGTGNDIALLRHFKIRKSNAVFFFGALGGGNDFYTQFCSTLTVFITAIKRVSQEFFRGKPAFLTRLYRRDQSIGVTFNALQALPPWQRLFPRQGPLL